MIYTKKSKITKAIREAIDSYPEGLCFATLEGMPILVNEQMNRLVSKIVGHTIIDAIEAWNDIKFQELEKGVVRIKNSWLINPVDNIEEIEQVFIELNGAIWQFEKQILTTITPNVIQLSANEVTELYRVSLELYENNLKLKALQERQRELLDNIVQINQEKEILETKVKIHDELGRCIIATRKSLEDENIEKDAKMLYEGWKDTLRDLTNIPFADSSSSSSALEELLQVAEMIGCKIEFIGELMGSTSCQLLIFTAIREALTNAVRHGNADLLIVEIEETDDSYKVSITNNGEPPSVPIKEGVGLSGLRRKMEQEGASLVIESFPVVKLRLMLPKEKSKGVKKRW